MDWTLIITGAISALGGGVLTAGGKILYDRQKLAGEQKLAESAQITDQYEGIIEDLRNRVVSLEVKDAKCSQDYAECRYEVGQLRGMITEMRENVQHLRTTTTEQAKDAVKAAAVVAAHGVRAAAEAAKSASDSAILKTVDAEHPLPVKVME